MEIHALTSEAALESLRAGRNGLSEADAAGRLAEFGANRVERVRRAPLAVRLGREFVHLFALILWVAAALAFLADALQPGQGMAGLAWAIVGVILVNGLFSFWQVYQAERAIESLRKLLPSDVTVLREGQAARIDSARLVPGDIVLMAAGDRIAADCRLIEAFDVRVDMSTVTGESAASARNAEPDAVHDLLHGRNIVLAGTSLVQGRATGVVFATGGRSEFGKIAQLTQAAEEPLSPLQREIARLSRLVACLATLLGALCFAMGQVLGLSFWHNFVFAIGIIVANVPEGLLPTVTLAMAMASKRMARRQTLVRHLPAVETLGAATVICTDKTGTLTENRMTARQVYLGDRWQTLDELSADDALRSRNRPFFEAAALCEDVRVGHGNGQLELVGDPTEVALVEMGRRVLGTLPAYPKRDEIAFDSERKRLATLHDTPAGPVLYLKGALEVVLARCRYGLADGIEVPLTADDADRHRRAHDTMAAQGLRVLAIAYRPVPADCRREALEEDLVFAGLVGVDDPPRPEVPAAIAQCHRAGIRVVMITGDHPETARAVARQVGLVRSVRPRIVTGDELRRLSDTQLQLALDASEILFARIGADQKLRIVRALQQKNAVVAVTGDGVNDAPALKAADIGIAMGVTGTDVAKDAADMILLDDNFASIVNAIEEGRGVFDNIRKFLTYILTSNIPEIVPYLAFVAFGVPLPLTIVQILAVDLGTDIVPALGLGAEPPEHDVMDRPPRPATHRLMDGALLARAYLFLGVIEAVAAMAAYFFVLEAGQWRWGQHLDGASPLYRQATTACLTAIVLMQMVNVYLCRSDRASVVSRGLVSNRLIVLGLAVELGLILLIDYTPVGQVVFGTAPIGAEVWLFIVPFGAAMLALEESRKAVIRWSRPWGTQRIGDAKEARQVT
jgi:calcium-translocating P-type ATPase